MLTASPSPPVALWPCPASPLLPDPAPLRTPPWAALTAAPDVTSHPVGQVAEAEGPPLASWLPPLLAVTPTDLTYRGEGADHIVLGLSKLGQVLRLRKTPVGGAGASSREELVRRAARDEECLRRVGRPLLGRLLTDATHLVLVAPRPHSALSDAVQPWRQGYRQDKEINVHGVACICPDAATIFLSRRDSSPPSPAPAPAPKQSRGQGGQWYPRGPSNVCIEIKPKQGFLDHSTPGLPLCRYCVKQFLKRCKKEGASRSAYCPLDLFSGRLERMRRAVDSLIQSPQNNFKVFVDGQPVDDCKPFSYLRDVIIAALTFDFTSGRATLPEAEDRLMERSALGRILTFQSLDRLGVFRASHLYLTLTRLLGSSHAADSALHDLSAWPSPLLDHLTAPSPPVPHTHNDQSSVLHVPLSQSGKRREEELQGEEKEEEEKSVEEIVQLLQSYLLSTTAKDLSLMILLSGPHYSSPPQYSPNTSPFIIEVEAGVWFKAQVTGVDFVAKPTSKILKHERDYKQLRDVLLDLRARGEAPLCCR